MEKLLIRCDEEELGIDLEFTRLGVIFNNIEIEDKPPF